MALRYHRMTSASGASPDPIPKAYVPQVLQEHQPLLHPVAMDRRHPGPRRLEKPVHVQEGELIERFAEHR